MKAILIGYSGQMGKLIYKRLKKEVYFETLLDKEHNLLKDEQLNNIDFAIDFSNAIFSYDYIIKIINHKIPMIIGTTGFTDEQIKTIEKQAKANSVGVYLVANFDRSVYDFIEAINKVSKYFTHATIIETHAKSKKDIPSGTSKLIKNLIKVDSEIISKRINKKKFSHKVILENKNLKLTFVHDVKNRNNYVDGVCNSLYSLFSFIGLKTML